MAVTAENAEIHEGVRPAERARDDVIDRERKVRALAEGAEGEPLTHLARDRRPLCAVAGTATMVGEGVDLAP